MKSTDWLVNKHFQDHRDKKIPHQEDDHHEAVEDGEPVDPVLEKVGVQIFVETVLKESTLSG